MKQLVVAEHAGGCVAPGRTCGTCTLCCKVLAVKELEKPQGVWCRHCAIGVGCRSYDERPAGCRDFHCGYLTLGELSDAWRPSVSKIVLVAELGVNRIAVHVDPDRPGAWKTEPYYSELKEWSKEAMWDEKQIVVYVNKKVIVILPDRDVDLGVMADGDVIVTTKRRTRSGFAYDAIKIGKDDPRAARPSRPGPGAIGVLLVWLWSSWDVLAEYGTLIEMFG